MAQKRIASSPAMSPPARPPPPRRTLFLRVLAFAAQGADALASVGGVVLSLPSLLLLANFQDSWRSTSPAWLKFSKFSGSSPPRSIIYLFRTFLVKVVTVIRFDFLCFRSVFSTLTTFYQLVNFIAFLLWIVSCCIPSAPPNCPTPSASSPLTCASVFTGKSASLSHRHMNSG
jgi:hypothetical protein